MPKLKIAFVLSEAVPFAKTGGLADFGSGLPRYLARQGHDVRLWMPRYSRVKADGLEPVPAVQGVAVGFGPRTCTFGLRRGALPGSQVPVYFVDCPDLYGRDAIYTQDQDEHLRFALLCRAALESCQRLAWAPDIVHCNDWHTGLLPLYLRTLYAWDKLFARSKTVLTLHNIGYQGVFGAGIVDELGLGGSRGLLHQDDLRKDQVNYLRTGVLYADALTTVSPTYAREIQTQEQGMGMHEVLRQQKDRLRGIVNGVDYGEWSPEADPVIPQRFSAEDLAGKARCKQALLERFHLRAAPRTAVLGMVSRLTYQKGIDLLPDVLPAFLAQHDVRFVALGSGEDRHERWLQSLRDANPGKVGIYRGYHEELAHWIEAGADVFLMPSRYEPCGLNQMYSLRYGTVPVVRRTGGLADTVLPFERKAGTGTGFWFEEFSAHALWETLRAVMEAWADEAAWAGLVRRGMAQDWSWERQGEEYVRLYEGLVG